MPRKKEEKNQEAIAGWWLLRRDRKRDSLIGGSGGRRRWKGRLAYYSNFVMFGLCFGVFVVLAEVGGTGEEEERWNAVSAGKTRNGDYLLPPPNFPSPPPFLGDPTHTAPPAPPCRFSCVGHDAVASCQVHLHLKVLRLIITSYFLVRLSFSFFCHILIVIEFWISSVFLWSLYFRLFCYCIPLFPVFICIS